jgi:ABC-type amino acid transport substrate-binding protein
VNAKKRFFRHNSSRFALSRPQCLAIGAAIFEEEGRVDFKSLNYQDRFVALESTQVDLLAAGVTHTMERDLFEVRVAAGPPMLFFH